MPEAIKFTVPLPITEAQFDASIAAALEHLKRRLEFVNKAIATCEDHHLSYGSQRSAK